MASAHASGKTLSECLHRGQVNTLNFSSAQTYTRRGSHAAFLVHLKGDTGV